MNKIDGLLFMQHEHYLELDYRMINTLLVVLETGSITAAAQQLNVTQSAVSHTIERLRVIFHDPLFTRAGRGIVPTARAVQLGKELSLAVAHMRSLVQPTTFNPAQTVVDWKLAANDFQRDLILPEFYRRVAAQVLEFHLHIIPSEVPSLELLRDNNLDLVLSPICPDAPDILQKRLFTGKSICFFDNKIRPAPRTLADFQQAAYVSLSFLDGKILANHPDEMIIDMDSKVRVRVSNFAGLAGFLRGTNLLAIAPDLMRYHALAGFAEAALPFAVPTLSMYMLWHQRHQTNPLHSWLRAQLEASCAHLRSQARP